MNISKIKKDLEGQKDFPPVDKWNPELCEGQEFFIDREGNWFHNNSPIKNKKLINLFSTVIRKDDDNYFLVTPVEKVPVKVELAPYKIIDFAINFSAFDAAIKSDLFERISNVCLDLRSSDEKFSMSVHQ